MLSVFWFFVFLLIIWTCFYHAFIEDDGRLQQNIIITTLMISAFLTMLSWDWIFSSWLKFIYSLMPQDNELIMIGSACLITLLLIVAFYVLPAFIYLKIMQYRSKSASDAYLKGKMDAITGKQRQKQSKKYLSGYKDGLTVSTNKDIQNKPQ